MIRAFPVTQVLVQLCLAEGAIDGALLRRLVTDHDLGFQPRTLSTNVFGRGGVTLDEAALARLAGVRRLGWADLTGPDGEELALSGIGGQSVHQVIWKPGQPPADLDLVDTVTALPGFAAGHLADADDLFWQSETSIATYEAEGRPHDDLPKVEGGFFPGEDEEIDVSRNPGRSVALGGMWLVAAATMWFGAGAFRLLDRDRLLGTPVGDVEERADGVVRVDLFPLDWYASEPSEVRDRQRRFREWMGYDELESRADEIEAATPSNPVFELDVGRFDHGGVRRLTAWLDGDGRAVPRSEARRFRVVELDESGKPVFDDEGAT